MKKVSVDDMADEIVKGLEEYAKLTTDEMKKAVAGAGRTVRKEIQKKAPVDTGAYKKSWSVKKDKETASTLQLVVHSRNRYQLAHLLEHGHAKRGGGRVAGKAHIKPAEDIGTQKLEEDIQKAIRRI